MTYLPAKPVTSTVASTLSDVDTFALTQSGVAKTAPLSLLKAYVGGGSTMPTMMRGVNMLMLGNGSPGGTNYGAPSNTHLDYYSGKGIKFLRCLILWERLQPTLNGPLDTTYAALIDDTLTRMAARGMYALLDVHNYMAYQVGVTPGTANSGTSYQVGSTQVPLTALYDLWNKIVTRWKSNPAVLMWGLMNEPTPSCPFATWQTAAQQLVTNIRAIESSKYISCGVWNYNNINAIGSGENANLNVSDPAGKLLYEIHGGLEGDALDTYLLGTYDYYTTSGPTDSYSGLRMGTALNQSRVDRVVAWVNARSPKPFGILIGEWGCPSNDSRYITLMQDWYSRMPSSWWVTYFMDGAGAFDDSLTNTSCAPINASAAGQSCEVAGTLTDRLQMPLLVQQAALGTTGTVAGPTGSTGSTGSTGGSTSSTGSTGATAAPPPAPTYTNSITNPNGTGAIAGTPGTPPTNWSVQVGSGLSSSIVGQGTENGYAYTDIRFFGTSTGGENQISVQDPNYGFAAATGQTWTHSFTWRLATGSLTNVDKVYTQLNEAGSGGAYVGGVGYAEPTLTSTANNVSESYTISDAGVAFLKPIVGLHSAAGAVDVTVRLSNPVDIRTA